MTTAGVLIAGLAAVYAVVGVAILLGVLSWEHMGRPGVRAMFRKRPSDWVFAAGLSALWLPALVVVLFGRMMDADR